MSERIGYWRWLGGGLVTLPWRLKTAWISSKWVRKSFFDHIKHMIKEPTTETCLGLTGFMLSVIVGSVGVFFNAPVRDIIVFSVAAVFTFLLMTHGIYRCNGDC